ncbi:hypothetical protein EAX61_12835 [Dokdonia sinensis]|uniref:Uncharacterized protein n=1 Tax=Dokdonia sinensis TaxID=2479847 RepID=A0A3M0G520_9FLAO|nr:hypothetical protein [Dokdonia sinensis]RMB56943.1 hypothetical protein EAX61_12835 [Dokdonia sinensis]
MKKLFLVIGFALLACISCQEKKSEKPTDKAETTNENLALKPDSWIKDRVSKAEKQLNSSEAGKIVWQAMEAHGGLDTWYKNGPLSFHFDYVPLDGSTRRNTYQTVDTWSNKARHQNVDDRSQEFGWTGEKAWKKVKDSTAFPFDMRFWALTPYYFLGQPFILDGEGVRLEKLADKTHKDVTYDAIKVTFAEGTGDAPDDYYVLYFGEENHKLAVIRYIVSYPQYFPDGGHLPEKLMELQGTTIVNGIELATGYHTHWLTEDEKAGEHITTIEVSDITFAPETKSAYFEMPDGAEVIEMKK